jgi:hypothetical protein
MSIIDDIQSITGLSKQESTDIFCNMHYDNSECTQKEFEQEIYYTINNVLFWANKLTDSQHKYFRSL